MRIEVPQRIVRERRQMTDDVEAGQVGDADVTDVQAPLRKTRGRIAEQTIGKQIAVQTGHVVSSRQQPWCKHVADVTARTGNQDTHQTNPPNSLQIRHVWKKRSTKR